MRSDKHKTPTYTMWLYGEVARMVMRALSPRRCFLFLVASASLVLLAFNIHYRGLTNSVVWPGPAPAPGVVTQQQLKYSDRDQLNTRQPPTYNTSSNDPIDMKRFIKNRPWFMTGGTRQPNSKAINKKTGKRLARLFPNEAPGNDRIANQLMYSPPNYSHDATNLKTIVIMNGLNAWGSLKPGRSIFTKDHCPVDTCMITSNRDLVSKADALLFKDHFITPGVQRSPNQVWILYFLECPYHTQHIKYADVFNWTATYRRDSDIVAPYERWTYYDERIKQIPRLDRNYAENKTRKVAWFVSNCGARNGRLQYARELQKYIQVDIFGACGPMKCPRSDSVKCFELLDKDYKFYLSFENSNCRDYITEKFFVNGLGHNVLPIVMGARPEDYERSSPYRSYIHVDEFESPRELADYLHRLDADDELYNSYFRWKGTGEFINTYFWCRLCAMLHDDAGVHKSYSDVNEWWRGNGVCTSHSWRKAKSSARSAANNENAD